MKPMEKIYKAFYDSKKLSLYFNELKELTGLSDSSLNRNLKELIVLKEVKKDKQKSNTFYSLVNKNLKAVNFAKFDILKFESLDYRVNIPIREFMKQCPKEIYTIIFFGSASRGEERKGSDLDLLIVLENFEDDELQKLYEKEIKKRFKKLNMTSIYRFSPIYCTRKDLIKNEDYLIKSANQTGFPIINQIRYYSENENK